jgi:hypothetical protein
MFPEEMGRLSHHRQMHTAISIVCACPWLDDCQKICNPCIIFQPSVIMQPRESSTTCDSTRSTEETGFDGISIKVHSTRCDVILNGHQRDCIGGLIKLGALHNTAWREIHFVPKPVKCTVHLTETPFESTSRR